jgi:hypothetical protein
VGRRAWLSVGVLAMFASTVPHSLVRAQDDVPLLASGATVIAVVDVNRNGRFDDAEDCQWTAAVKADASGAERATLTIIARQSDSSPILLAACNTDYTGTSFVGIDSAGEAFAEVSIAKAANPGQRVVAQFAGTPFAERRLPASESRRVVSRGPMGMGAALLLDRLGKPRGSGFLCRAGGVAARVTLDDGVTVLVGLEPRPSAAAATHLCAPSLPFKTTAGQTTLLEACFPVRSDGGLDIAYATDPGHPAFDLQLDRLPPCSGRTGLTWLEWGMIAATLLLLSGAVWLARRRGWLADFLPVA